MDLRARIRGSLLGLATGDALGVALEFKAPGSFVPITDMTGGGPFGLAPGEWTDDTSLALCLAESLVETGGFDAGDQLRRYVRWYRDGYWSSTGHCFDIGTTTRAALEHFERTGEAQSGPVAAHTAGNGSLMRVAPVPLCFAADPAGAIELAGSSSRTTHGAHAAIDACRYYAALIVGALHGRSKAQLMSSCYAPLAGYWHAHPLHDEIAEVARGSFLRREPPAIRGEGYVVRTLEAALWAFARSDDFVTGALLAVNLGDDADTTGAVYGQLAGVFYGEAAIPERWRAQLTRRADIERMADRLYDVSRSLAARMC